MTPRPVKTVIVAFNALDALERCLTTLDRSTEVTVVDNSSSSDIRDIVRRHDGGYLDPGGNVGFAAGVNNALRPALDRAPHDVLLLNPDASLAPDGLGELVKFLHAPGNARLGGVAPRLVDSAGREQRVVVAIALAVSDVDGGTWSGTIPRSFRLRRRGGGSAPLGGAVRGRAFRRTLLPLRGGDRLAAPCRNASSASSAMSSCRRRPDGAGRAGTCIGGVALHAAPETYMQSGTGGSAGGATGSPHVPERPHERWSCVASDGRERAQGACLRARPEA